MCKKDSRRCQGLAICSPQTVGKYRLVGMLELSYGFEIKSIHTRYTMKRQRGHTGGGGPKRECQGKQNHSTEVLEEMDFRDMKDLKVILSMFIFLGE